jgi:Ca2+/H+ antiporter, TMEM165/GDT1 family
VQALRTADRSTAADVSAVSGRGIFLTTLLLIFVAEFGDKTQIAVAALAGSLEPAPVWAGSTAALIVVSALGVWAGRTLLQRLPLAHMHRLSGILFLLFALVAAWHALPEAFRGQVLPGR